MTLHMIELLPTRRALLRFLDREGLLDFKRFDLGYGVHAWLQAAFGHLAPTPFRIFLRRDGTVQVLGYSGADAEKLRERLEAFADPVVFEICPPDRIASRPMPRFSKGRCLGFEVLCCPVARRTEDGKTIEKDVFLARCDRHGGETPLRRAVVYAEWLREKLDGAAELVEMTVMGFKLQRLLRKTQGGSRQKRWLQRPEALFSGTLLVSDGEAFARLLRRGIGRHRAFGYGMLLLKP